jgi:hypothetical protein
MSWSVCSSKVLLGHNDHGARLRYINRNHSDISRSDIEGVVTIMDLLAAHTVLLIPGCFQLFDLHRIQSTERKPLQHVEPYISLISPL